jgi:hypothetical protein
LLLRRFGMNEFYISMAIAVVLQVIKDRKLAERIKPALRKVHDAIEMAFPEFKAGA